MKTQEKLNALKQALSDDELEQVTGGAAGGNKLKDKGGKKKNVTLKHGVKNNNAAENVSEVVSYSVTPI